MDEHPPQTSEEHKPTEFQLSGFLSQCVQAEVDQFRKIYPAWVQLYFAANRCAQELLYRVEVHASNAAHLLIYSAFYRAITTFQGTFLQVERGMDMEAKVLLRTLTDVALTITAAAKDIEFVKRYIRADEDSRRKLTKRLLTSSNAPSFLPPEQIAHLQSELDALEAKKKAGGQDWQSQLQILEIATAAGLVDVYNQHFCYLSLFTHPSPLGMAQFLIQDAEGRVTNFRTGRFDDDAEANMRVGLVMMLQALSATSVAFRVDISSELSGFATQLEQVIQSPKTQEVSA